MWLCNSKEATEHLKECKNTFNCDKCQWIDASSGAMEDYGTEVIVEPDPHPLTGYVIDRFGGQVE